MKNDNPHQINLANFFIYNTEYGQKEGREAEKIFYYYPSEEKIEKQIRLVGFCAGVVKFTETFKSNKPCEFVHTEQTRMIFNQVDDNFWMVIGLSVPITTTDKTYDDDQISNPVYMSVLKQSYNLFKLFHGTLNDSLARLGHVKLKENLKIYFDDYIQNKLKIHDCDIMNTFNGIHFMSLDRCMYLKIQCLLNYLEERIPLVNKAVVMHNDQVIWSGLEQEDIASIYTYLKELVISNLNNPATQLQPGHIAKFLIGDSVMKRIYGTTEQNQNSSIPTTSRLSSLTSSQTKEDLNYYEFEEVYLGRPLEKYYLIPYNLSKLTFFIFIQVNESFKLSLLNEIDQILGSHMVVFLQEIADQSLKRTLINPDEKEIKYIYFNRLNLAQKSTLLNTKDTPKYILNLISQLSKDLETCKPTGEIFVKSGRDYWIACKKSDLREVYVIVCQKNANLTLIDEEVKQLCTTNFSNIFFME